jgi:hypothetical protein
MTNEMNQQIEYLGLDWDEFAFSPQFVLRQINLEVSEAEIQGLPRLRGCPWAPWLCIARFFGACPWNGRI